MSQTTIAPTDLLRVEDPVGHGERWFRIVDRKASAALGREFLLTLAIASPTDPNPAPWESKCWHVTFFAIAASTGHRVSAAASVVRDDELEALVRIYADAMIKALAS